MKGWHNESARHSLSAKGIPTTAFRVVREYHSARPLDARESDEARIEPYVEDVALWISDPDKYDIEGIDDPVPEGLEIERVFHSAVDSMEIRMTEKEGGTVVGYADLDEQRGVEIDGLTYYPFSLSVSSEYRGDGLSRYLMRELVNLSDNEGFGMVSVVQPTHDSPVDKEILEKYYASFGFTTFGGESNQFTIIRRPQPKEGSLNE